MAKTSMQNHMTISQMLWMESEMSPRCSCLNTSFLAGNAFWVTKDILGDCRHEEC